MSIPDLRIQTITNLGYTSFWSGTPKEYIDLTPQEQINVTNAMEKYIVANPDSFPSQTVDFASGNVAQGGIQDIHDYTPDEMAADFGDEFVNQAVAINKAVNPFSNNLLMYGLLAAGAIVLFIAVNNKTAHK